MVFIGQLDDPAKLAGVGMGNMIVTIFGLSVIFRMNEAIETLVSQAFGSNNLRLCGMYLNRG